MSEFGFDDICRWMELAYDRDISIHKAIYYDLYFDCIRDEKKFLRADTHFRDYLKDKLAYEEKAGTK